MSLLGRQIGRRSFLTKGSRLGVFSAFALTFGSTIMTACVDDDSGSDDDDDGDGYGYDE